MRKAASRRPSLGYLIVLFGIFGGAQGPELNRRHTVWSSEPRLAKIGYRLASVCKFIVSNFNLGLSNEAIDCRKIKPARALVNEQLVEIRGRCAKRSC